MTKYLYRISGLILITFILTSCTVTWHQFRGRDVRHGVSSSLVDYLYPNDEIPPAYDQNIPNLLLPLRIGLAFVPTSNQTGVEAISEANKANLLEKVKKTFEGQEFIKEILIIPDTYMRSSKGFKTIEQIGRLYGLDVMALVSYDQVAHMDDTKASILYWTIIGAYFIKGSKNDVQTFVDTAVFDINTHKLLFRAPGVNKIESKTTLINNPEELRKGREESFGLAMADMTENLIKELDSFKERIKQDKSIEISYRKGYTTGGGAFDYMLICLLLILLILNYNNIKRRKNINNK